MSLDRDSSGKLTLSQPTSKLTGDTDAEYFVEVNESSFSEDKFIFAISSDGLLQSSQSVVEDKSSAIVGKIIEIFTEVAKFSKASGAPQATPPTPFHYDISVDPFNDKSIYYLRNQIKASGFSVDFQDLSGKPISPVSSDSVSRAAATCKNSLCFRLLKPLVVNVRSNQAAFHGRYLITVPDPVAVVGIDLNRGPCIKRDTKLTFSNGIITQYDLTKPSEFLGCLEIPLQIAKAIAAIPGQLLTFRVEQIGNDTKLLNAQSDLLAAQARLVKAQADAVAAKPENQ